MATITEKIKSFEFLTERVLSRHEGIENDFSKLKLLKLLFFFSAAQASQEQDGLLAIFDNFWAMPYGHVEVDIYENLHLTQRIKVDKSSTQLLPVSNDYYNEIEEFKSAIDSSVSTLFEINPNLVDQKAFDLVELSHQWQSWKSIFSLARNQNKLSMKIPTSIIKAEPKIFKMAVNDFF